MKTTISLGIFSTTKRVCERRIKNRNFVITYEAAETSRTGFIMTYRLTLVKNLTIMVVWQSAPCKLNNNCRVKEIFEDHFWKHRLDLEIIFFIKRCWRLHFHIPTLKEEKECSSETLVSIYQTIRRHIIEGRSHENLRSHKTRTLHFSILANRSCQKIFAWRLYSAFWPKYFFINSDIVIARNCEEWNILH